jgi:hypothetical protein
MANAVRERLPILTNATISPSQTKSQSRIPKKNFSRTKKKKEVKHEMIKEIVNKPEIHWREQERLQGGQWSEKRRWQLGQLELQQKAPARPR